MTDLDPTFRPPVRRHVGPGPLADAGLDAWHVASLVDPHGTGADLAFTDGLVSLGLPELLLWARPTEGSDPGADWLLTHRERCRLLDRWAYELITGDLGPHAERLVDFDGGDTAAGFRFGAPQFSSAISHPFLRPGTPIVSIRWSMTRQPLPGRRPARTPRAVERRVQRWIDRAAATTLEWAGEPGTLWRAEAGASGATPPAGLDLIERWLAARGEQVLAVDADVLGVYLLHLWQAGLARCPDCLMDELLKVATRAGRHPACRGASNRAQELRLALTGHIDQPSARWRLVEREGWSGAGGGRAGLTVGLDAAGHRARSLLAEGLDLLMVAAALADVAPAELTASATGPWEWAVSGGRLPGREWLAPPLVRAAVRAGLDQASPEQVIAAVERRRAMALRPDARAVSGLVQGLRVTGPASATPGTLVPRALRARLPQKIRRDADALAEQATAVLAAPGTLDPAEFDLVRGWLGELIPGLRRASGHDPFPA